MCDKSIDVYNTERGLQVVLVVKNPPANPGDIRDMGSNWVRRTPGRGHGNPLQYSCLENPMDKAAWQAKVHRVTKSQTWLSDFTFFSPKQTTIKLRQILSCDKAFSTFVKLYKESRVLKNWCFWTVVLKMTLESPLDCKEIQPVHPKEDHQSWVFTGRTEVEAETSILWSPDAKSWLIWKDPDAGQDWGQEEKGTTEDEMVGSHHQLLEFTQT